MSPVILGALTAAMIVLMGGPAGLEHIGTAAAQLQGDDNAKSANAEAVEARKEKRAKRVQREGVSEREHRARGHVPHDPDCEACRAARMTAKQSTRNADPRAIQGAEKGFVLGLDLFGPFTPDVDGNEYALVAVEVGRTDFGFTRLLKDKTSESILEAYQDIVREIKVVSAEDTEVVRVHSDRDSGVFGEAFAGYVKEHAEGAANRQWHI